MRFGPIFCQILSGEQRDLLSYSVRKLLFLSHHRNPDSSVSQRLVFSITVMPSSASSGLASDWVKPTATFSWPEKLKSEHMPGAWSFSDGVAVATFLCYGFCGGVWDSGVRTSEDSKGSVLVPAIHIMRRCRESRCYSLQWCNLVELRSISSKVQYFLEKVRFVHHTLRNQLIFSTENIFLTILCYWVAFNYLPLLWLYACF